MIPYLAMTSDIMGVKTDDVLAHVLVFTAVGFWTAGIIAQFFLKRFVDEERLRADPALKKNAFQSVPPPHLLTEKGRKIRTLAFLSMGIGAVFLVITGVYVYNFL